MAAKLKLKASKTTVSIVAASPTWSVPASGHTTPRTGYLRATAPWTDASCPKAPHPSDF
jgi:hypothetical protein